MSGAHFGDRLTEAVALRESQIVLGLDPVPSRLWPQAMAGIDDGPRGWQAATAVFKHCTALIDAAGEACVAVKPQLASFERLGADGRAALQAVCDHAHAQGLLVLADGKRGDIAVSAEAYAQSLLGSTPTPFGEVPGLGADAITASPYMGVDSLEPLLEVARVVGAGVFTLVRTSNPGAKDVEDLGLALGGTVWERVAAIVAALGLGGPESGLSDVGAVVGATRPEHVARMRELMPATPFLLPGVGAQGGQVEALAPAFAPGRAAGLITVSRSIAQAHEACDLPPSAAARDEAERLREAAWALA